MKREGQVRVMLADDHAVVRQGLRAIVDGEPDMDCVGEVTDGNEVVAKTLELDPDVILMDITMPGLGGLEATRAVKTMAPDARVLILTMHESEECLQQALSVGADGYLTKSAQEPEILLAIRSVHRGRCYIDPCMTDMLVTAFVKGSGPSGEADRYGTLTAREKELLALIASGKTNKQIARALELSEHTVHNHRVHLMEKLGLHDRMQLLKYAIRRGIVSP